MKKISLVFCLINLFAISQTKPIAKAQQTKTGKETKTDSKKATENVSDRKASYVGGNDAMVKFIVSNLKTPEKLKTDTTIKTKTVFLKFMLDVTGKVTNVTVMKGIKACKECNDEAIRVVSSMPNWNPAMEASQAKESWFNLPINFSK